MNQIKQTHNTHKILTSIMALVFCGLFFALPLSAQPKIPDQTAWVMDDAAVMSASQKNKLEQYLSNLDSASDVQVAVYIVDSLGTYALEDYSMAVAEKWQLGNSSSEKGVLLFVAMADRKIRIEVGYGAEGTLTDVKSGLIIRQVIAPYFQDGEYGSGIIAGVQTIANVVTENTAGLVDETIVSTVPEKESAAPSSGFSAFTLIVFLALMLLNFSHRGKRTGRYVRRTASGEIIHTAIWASILSGLFRSSGSGRGGSGFGGGGFSSGGGFGGFSGGGGGGFGGGGASGGW